MTNQELSVALYRIETKVDRLGVMLKHLVTASQDAVTVAVATEKLREATAELDAAIDKAGPTPPPPPE